MRVFYIVKYFKDSLDPEEETQLPNSMGIGVGEDRGQDGDGRLNPGREIVNPEQNVADNDGREQEGVEEDDNDEMLSKIPEHLEFFKMLRNGQKMADHIKSKIPIVWRGYKTSVFPNMLTFTPADLNERLITALKNILDTSPDERKVN